MGKTYTPEELAGAIHVPVSTLAWWRRKGTGPKFYYAGRHPRYREAAVAEWEKEQEHEASAARA